MQTGGMFQAAGWPAFGKVFFLGFACGAFHIDLTNKVRLCER